MVHLSHFPRPTGGTEHQIILRISWRFNDQIFFSGILITFHVLHQIFWELYKLVAGVRRATDLVICTERRYLSHTDLFTAKDAKLDESTRYFYRDSKTILDPYRNFSPTDFDSCTASKDTNN